MDSQEADDTRRKKAQHHFTTNHSFRENHIFHQVKESRVKDFMETGSDQTVPHPTQVPNSPTALKPLRQCSGRPDSVAPNLREMDS